MLLRPGLSLAVLAAVAMAGIASARAEPADDRVAKAAFGAVRAPAASAPPRAAGFYARGCLTGAVALPADGPNWQAMRLSRNRFWGHPDLIAFVKDLAAAAPALGLRGILVGDLSQPRGGPMPYGHTSHQVGLDVDLWFREMPRVPLTPRQRERHPFVSTLNDARDGVDPARLTRPFMRLLERAARDGRVQRVFVHPLIKRALCRAASDDRAWLGRIRPWHGHDAHFHVRLACPAGSPRCRPQRPPPEGEGCGAALDAWFTPAPEASDPDAQAAPPLTVADLPRACHALVGAP